MTHCFIINPNAGYSDISLSLKEEISTVFSKINQSFEIYLTKGDQSDDDFIKNRLKTGEEVRFYACGGDGTVHNVVNSIYGYKNASFAVIPCGTGNDYIKSIGGYQNLANLMQNGSEKFVDLTKVNDRVCMNIVSMGLDAEVNANTMKYKKHPIFKGIAYYVGVLESILGKLGAKVSVEIDNEPKTDTNILMLAVAKGSYYGKTFYAAPLANVSDGKIDICLVRKIPLLRILTLIGKYQKGTHVGDPKFSDVLIYKKADKIRIKSQKDLPLSLDGELDYSNDINIEVAPKAVRLFSLLD